MPASMASRGDTPPRQRPPLLRRPWRRLSQLLAVGAGLVVGGGLLALVWPAADRASRDSDGTAVSLGPLPNRPITLLVIGTDADRLGASGNGAAPRGPANSDVLLLVRVDPRQPLQVLNLPTELAVQLPGQKAPQALGALYRRGGVALTADVAAELVGLGKGQPDRYLLLTRGALRQLVDAAGGLELSPDRTMRYEDKAQKYKIDLQGGLQLLNGAQVEQMVRFRDPASGEAGRRQRQQQAIGGLTQQLRQPGQLSRLPELVNKLHGSIETNLTDTEALALLAASLGPTKPIRFASLSLAPPSKPDQPLRQLTRDGVMPLWPAP